MRPFGSAGRAGARAGLAVVAAAAMLGGCGPGVASFSFPTPPPGFAVVRSTGTAPVLTDPQAIVEPTVVSPSTTVVVTFGPGGSTLDGTVSGPGGPIPGAVVSIQRILRSAMASTEVVTDRSGRFQLSHILGGRYRLRAWQAPTLAMTKPQILFVGANATATVALDMASFAAPAVTSAFSPSPSTLGSPTTVAVEVSAPIVSALGQVSYPVVAGATVALVGSGSWSVAGAGDATTDRAGIATFVATCEVPGSGPLTALVEGTIAVDLSAPSCIAPSPSTTLPAGSPTTLPAGSPTTLPTGSASGSATGSSLG